MIGFQRKKESCKLILI